jgi:hypothetical protein
MEYWLRSATLQIGAKRFSIDDLTFEFTCPFADSDEPDAASIKVYNLNAQSRNALREHDVIILNGGYENDVGVIFVGQIAKFASEKKGVDWVTTILATAAMSEWLDKQVNKTYNKNIQASAILADLLNIFGLEVGQLQLVKDITYPRGRVCKGPLRTVLGEIIMSDCKSRFLIKQGQIIISDPNNGDRRGYVLTGATGLLRSTGESVSLQIDKPQTTQDSKSEKEEKEKLIQRASLLNYHLGPGEVVVIKDSELNGRFLIVKGSHVGNKTGEWRTNLEVRPL